MWNFKGTLWNSMQVILPIHWNIWFLYNINILRALRLKSSNTFLKRPPGIPIIHAIGHMSSSITKNCSCATNKSILWEVKLCSLESILHLGTYLILYNYTQLVLYLIHDDVIKWKHFLCYWPFVWGIHRSPENSTGHRWIPRTKASDMGFWYFLWSAAESTVE